MKHVLDLPFGADELKEKYGLKTIKGGYALYSGVLLPRELRPYKAEDFSYIRWLEDEANAHVSVPDRQGRAQDLTLEEENIVDQVVQAYSKGSAGFILEEKAGHVHEKLALYSVAAMTKTMGNKPWDDDSNKAKLLIVTSKSMVAHWRETLKTLPVVSALARPLIITPSQLNKLLMAPAAARIAAKKSTKERSTARNGVPTIDWNFVIFDQPNTYGDYPQSALASSAAAVAKLNKAYSKASTPFTLFLVNHIKRDPLSLSLMAKVMSPALEKGKQVLPLQWATFLKDQGFAVRNTSKGFVWMGDPPKRGPESKILTSAQASAIGRRDSLRVAKLLETSPFARIPASPSSFPIEVMPLDIRGTHKVLYSSIWGDLKTWLNRHPMNTDPEGYAQQIARYFWRVNEVKKDYIFDLVTDRVELGEQVYLKVHTLEAVAHYSEKLTKKKISHGIMGSQNEKDHGDMLKAFASGRAQVLIVTDFLAVPERPVPVAATVVLTDVQMLSTLRKDYSTFMSEPPLMVYLPFIEKSIEESILALYLPSTGEGNGYNVEGLAMEKLLRIAAAKTTPPNRMS